MEERTNRNQPNKLPAEKELLTQNSLTQEEGFCSAEFSSGCIFDEE